MQNEARTPKHEILNGLPPYGPPAEAFSATGQGTHREGYVVRFHPRSGDSWVGNFQPGLTRFSAVFDHPDPHQIVVIAGGQAYIVDPETRQCTVTFGGAIHSAIPVPELNLLLFENGTDFQAIGPKGTQWKSARLSWDGFRSIHVDDATLTAEAFDAVHDRWCKFSLNVLTGASHGGTYPA